MTPLHIRDAQDGDQDAIQTATLAAYQEYAPLMVEYWEDYRQSILATLADITPAEQIVAEQGNGIVGSVLLYPAGTALTLPDGTQVRLAWPEVRLLAVVPGARGQGIGAALVQECLRRARQSGATALTLHTTDMMQAAMRMYEQMGFRRAPELDFHPVPQVTIKGYRFNLEDRLPPVS